MGHFFSKSLKSTRATATSPLDACVFASAKNSFLSLRRDSSSAFFRASASLNVSEPLSSAILRSLSSCVVLSAVSSSLSL